MRPGWGRMTLTALGRDHLYYSLATAENTGAYGSFEYLDPTAEIPRENGCINEIEAAGTVDLTAGLVGVLFRSVSGESKIMRSSPLSL
jgi:hypothetical protein